MREMLTRVLPDIAKQRQQYSHDPGWNDPPLFTYDKATAIQTAAANKKGISLNKRVAYPMGGITQSGSPTILDLTRPPSMTAPPPPMASSLDSANKLETPVEPEVKVIAKDRLEEVLKNLDIETNCDEEISKRIKIMEKMWEDDKLDANVRLKIFELSEALAKGDADAADHIQKGLMVDYVSQCSSWMGGIRHLINQKKK